MDKVIVTQADLTTCSSCLGDGVDGISYVGVFACQRCDGKGVVKQSLTSEPLSKTEQLDLDALSQWVGDGCPEGVSGIPSQVQTLIDIARYRLAAQQQVDLTAGWGCPSFCDDSARAIRALKPRYEA